MNSWSILAQGTSCVEELEELNLWKAQSTWGGVTARLESAVMLILKKYFVSKCVYKIGILVTTDSVYEFTIDIKTASEYILLSIICVNGRITTPGLVRKTQMMLIVCYNSHFCAKRCLTRLTYMYDIYHANQQKLAENAKNTEYNYYDYVYGGPSLNEIMYK